MRNLDVRKRVPRKILFQCLGANLVYSMAIFLFIGLASAFCNQFIWYWDNPLYRLLDFVRNNMPFFVVPVLLCGWLPITYYFLSKTLNELDEVAQAAEQLAAPGEEPISLSENLSYVEKELNRAREKALLNARAAKEAERRKNDLVVYLAHDLKTPLTSVLGYLTLLRDEPQISEELRQKYLNIALHKSERLEDLINEFFEITRFNLSEITLELTQVNLTRLLEQLIFEFQPMLMEKKLHCRLKIAQDTMLRCDADKIQRVFDNLLRNAVNYSDPGGEITICCIKEDGQMRITVSNPGPTIPQEKLCHIFEKFYRMDGSRSTASGGTGLGLAIAKEIVQHHGGTITAASAHQQIQFEVILPLS